MDLCFSNHSGYYNKLIIGHNLKYTYFDGITTTCELDSYTCIINIKIDWVSHPQVVLRISENSSNKTSNNVTGFRKKQNKKYDFFSSHIILCEFP